MLHVVLDLLVLIGSALFWWPNKASRHKRSQHPRAALAYWIVLGSASVLVVAELCPGNRMPVHALLVVTVFAFVLVVVSLICAYLSER